MISVDQISFPWTSQDDGEGDSGRSQRASWYSPDSLLAPRSSHRMGFEDRICLTGLDEQLSVCSATLLVRGRDVSADGISFTHLRPLPYRHVQLLLPQSNGPEAVIVRLTWCRYARHGEYVSGGYFVRSADVEASEPADWDSLDEA